MELDIEINELFETARNYVMNKEEQEEQRRNFAFGNAKLSNPLITREMINRAAGGIERERIVNRIKELNYKFY